MVGFIFGPAIRCFNADGGKAEWGEVVGTSAHVDFADVARKSKAVSDQFARDKRSEFKGPFIEIHIRMQTAPLFE